MRNAFSSDRCYRSQIAVACGLRTVEILNLEHECIEVGEVCVTVKCFRIEARCAWRLFCNRTATSGYPVDINSGK